MGSSTTASGYRSLAMGKHTIATHDNSLVIGQYNDIDYEGGNITTLFEVGCGTTNDRDTALYITTDGETVVRDLKVTGNTTTTYSQVNNQVSESLTLGGNIVDQDVGIIFKRDAVDSDTKLGFFGWDHSHSMFYLKDDLTSEIIDTDGSYQGGSITTLKANINADNIDADNIDADNVHISDNVGIGTTAPREKLDINGNLSLIHI